jgi:hypothetical protein
MRKLVKKFDPYNAMPGRDPGMFGLGGPMMEKSSGHPLLDRIQIAFRELESAQTTAGQYTDLCEALDGTVTSVKMSLVMVITGGELTKEQMMEQALAGNPDLAEALEQDPALRAQAEREMDELLAGGQNRQDRAFQLELDIPPLTAMTIVEGLQWHVPNPNPAYLAGVMREAASQVEDEPPYHD